MQLRSLQAYCVVFHECLQQNLMARYDIRGKYERDENHFHWFVRIVAAFFTRHLPMINLPCISSHQYRGELFRVKLYFRDIHIRVVYQSTISPKIRNVSKFHNGKVQMMEMPRERNLPHFIMKTAQSERAASICLLRSFYLFSRMIFTGNFPQRVRILHCILLISRS